MSHQADAQHPHDWYSVLGIEAIASQENVTAAVERLARQANALSITAPDRARQLRDQIRAIKQDLLSGPEQRARYNQHLAMQATASLPDGRPATDGPSAATAASPHRQSERGQGLLSRFTQFLQTGWTCSSCGYGALPTDKFCPKCGGKIQSRVQGRPAAHGQADASERAAAKPASCETCGSKLAPADAFCTKCGALRA